MTNQHPITPSPELIARCLEMFKLGAPMEAMCEVAVQWGADQELEACDDYVSDQPDWLTGYLTSMRRPKPPSLKEQALAILDGRFDYFDETQKGIIRRALEEALPND